MPVIVRIVLARGVLPERHLLFIRCTDVAPHQTALLVLEHAVDPGNTCIRLPRPFAPGHRLCITNSPAPEGRLISPHTRQCKHLLTRP